MSVADDLFSTSWQLDDLQLYNWGVYTGDHHVTLAQGVEGAGSITVVAGASGAGKSAILDAYTVLTRSRRNRLNRASDSGQHGAGARGVERTVASYVLGELKVREGNRGVRPVYLRRSASAQQAAWGAIRARFVSSMGQRLSFAQFIYVAAGERRDSKTIYVVSEGEIDCARAAKVSSSAFTPTSIRSVYGDALVVDDSSKRYRSMMHECLGTNERSDKLSHMMQSGWVSGDFRSVIRNMVLEEPQTIDTGRRVAERASSIERENADIVLRAKRRRALEKIQHLYAEYLDARERAAAYGSWTHEHADPADRRTLRSWFCGHALEVVEQDAEATKEDLDASVRQLHDLEFEIASAERAKDEAYGDWLRAGGENISEAKSELAQAERDLDEVKHTHAELERAFARVGEDVPDESRDSWEARKASLGHAAEAYDRAEAVTARNDELARAVSGVAEGERAVREAREAFELARRGKRIDADMARAQERLAEVTGMDAHELPYLAELIDIDGAQNERWREALNVALAKEADTILVTAPEHEFRRVVDTSDSRSYGRRMTYRFISESELACAKRPSERKVGWLSSILKVDETSKFADWVMVRLADSSHDYLLVEDGDFSRGERRQLSIKGQVKDGSKGRYGRGGRRPDFIGFASEDYIAARASELVQAEARLGELEAAKREVEERQCRESDERDLYLQVKALTWDAIFVESAQRAVDEARARLELLNSGDLGRLQGVLEARKNELRELEHARTVVELSRDEARDRLQREAKLAERLREPGGERAGAAYAGEELLRAFSDAWDAVFFDQTPAQVVGALVQEGGFEKRVGRIGEELHRIARHYGGGERDARRKLEPQLVSFKENYPGVVNPDTGTDAADAPVYLAKLVEGECDGSKDRASWISEMVQSLNEFIRCTDEYEQECKSSFKPVNEILAEHPFNDLGDVLSIEPCFERGDATWSGWLADAKRLVGEYPYVEPGQFRRRPEEQQLAVLSDVIECLKALGAGEDERPSTPLNDPRMRFEPKITVRPQDGSGREPEVIGGTSGMNGGKAEKTVAFVLAAIISCTLGMSRRGSLAYAPLAIDEAFTKSDGETTVVSFETLRRFGFQLLVAVPEEKIATLMTLCDRFYYVSRANEEAPSSIALPIDKKPCEEQ